MHTYNRCTATVSANFTAHKKYGSILDGLEKSVQSTPANSIFRFTFLCVTLIAGIETAESFSIARSSSIKYYNLSVLWKLFKLDRGVQVAIVYQEKSSII